MWICTHIVVNWFTKISFCFFFLIFKNLTETDWICCFIPQIPEMIKAVLDQSQRPGNQSQSPTWMAGLTCGSRHHCLPGTASTGSWNQNSNPGTLTCAAFILTTKINMLPVFISGSHLLSIFSSWFILPIAAEAERCVSKYFSLAPPL